MLVHKLEDRIARLEGDKAAREKDKLQSRQVRQQQKNEILEVDLHAHEILETTKGMDARAIKDYQLSVFTRTMNEHIREKGRKIVFIHGKGEGVLRKAIIDTLKDKYKSCEYQDASFQQYGFGATMVIVH
ncbi:MAG: Smr/MutS family protein [Bacteroidaceae bacterium]|nr:Smr/MutS family protein [Bacteroidaceae bacterium]MBR6197742.1 Smr/MutS family protein [Bacteroidaceae bacterium]